MNESAGTIKIGSFFFDTEKLRWSFLSGFPLISLQNATCSLEIDGRFFSLYEASSRSFRIRKISDVLGERRTLEGTFQFREPFFRWVIRWQVSLRDGFLIVNSFIKNLSGKPVRPGRCFLIDAIASNGGMVLLGKNLERATFLQFGFCDSTPILSRETGVEERLPPAGQNSRVKMLTSDGGNHYSNEICHLYNPESGNAFLSGFISFDSFGCRHHVRYARRKGIAELRAFCDLDGTMIQPQAFLKSEHLYIEFSHNPYTALERWADVVRKRYRIRLSAHTPAGWIGGAWVDVFGKKGESPQHVVVENCKAIRKRLAGFPFDYIWISLVNIHDMLPGNWLEFNRKKFPEGFGKTLKKIRRYGFKPGLWVAPFWVFEDAKSAFHQVRSAILRMPQGLPWIRKFVWPYTHVRPRRGKAFRVYTLDGTHPQAHDFIQKVFKRYRKLGVRYYMLDFLGGTKGVKLHNPSLSLRAAERLLMTKIRLAAGRDTHILTAVGSGMHYTGIVDAMRVSTDYGEGRPLYPPFRDFFTATFALNDQVASNHRDTLRNAACSFFTHRRLFINDCNLLTVDKPVPLNDARIATTIFAITGSPIMLGDDIRRIHQERLNLIKKCLPRTFEMACPVDLFRNVYPDGYPRIFSLRVKKNWDEFFVVAVFNFDELPYRTVLKSQEIGAGDEGCFWLYDFWNERYLGSFKEAFECHVPPCSVNVYRITRVRNHPWILSTDMHLLQGAVEILSVFWDHRKAVLSGVAVRPEGEVGNIFFLMPPGFRLRNHQGHWLARDYRDSSVIIRKEIHFLKKKMYWSLKFVRDTRAGREG